MSDFSNEQMLSAIEQNEIVKDCFTKIKGTCQELQNKTGCPNEDIDSLLKFLIGKWQ